MTTIKGEEPFYIQNQKSGHMKSEKFHLSGLLQNQYALSKEPL
ncbi:TPA: hypothetical protein ACU3W6_002836 [Staphylococcus aureus]